VAHQLPSLPGPRPSDSCWGTLTPALSQRKRERNCGLRGREQGGGKPRPYENFCVITRALCSRQRVFCRVADKGKPDPIAG
jgi:hypothetical protein